MDLQFTKEQRKIKQKKDWQIIGNEKEFANWNLKQSRHTLLFDGAAKGNPGRAGARGVIKNKDGRIMSRYA